MSATYGHESTWPEVPGLRGGPSTAEPDPALRYFICKMILSGEISKTTVFSASKTGKNLRDRRMAVEVMKNSAFVN